MTRCSLSTTALCLAGVFLSGCGKKTDPEPVKEKPTSPQAATQSISTLPSIPSFETPPPDLDEFASDSESDLQARIDAYMLDENGNPKNINELTLGAEFQELMSTVGEPSEEVALRIASAMQLMVTAAGEESEFARTGAGDSGSRIGTQDPEVIRNMIRFAIEGDPDKFYGAFAEAMEESGVALAIDPDADPSVKVIPPSNVISETDN